MSDELETVGITLIGGFAADADKASSSASKLADDLDRVGNSAGKIKPPKLDTALKAAEKAAAAAAKEMEKLAKAAEKAETKAKAAQRAAAAGSATKGIEDLITRANHLPTALQSGITPTLGGFAKLVQTVGNIFGPSAASGLTKGASFLATASDNLAPYGPLLSAAGGVIKTGAIGLGVSAVAVAAAAAAIVYGAVKLTAAAVEYGVQQSIAREKQVGILDKLTKGNGSATLDLAFKIAGQTGLDPTTVVDRMKGLLEAKFSKETISLVVRASADIGAVKGEEKGKLILDTLEKMAEFGKATGKELKALAGAGVPAQEVLKELAKKGESLKSVEARLKAGKISAEEFAKAVGKVVEKDLGGISGKGVEGLWNKLKIQFGQLFSGFNLGPIEGVLKNITSIFDGKGGAELKKSLTGLGSSAIKALFGPFEGEAGKQRLTNLVEGVTKAINVATKVIVALAPYIEEFVDGMSNIIGSLKASPGGEDSGVVKAIKVIGLTISATIDLIDGRWGDAIAKIQQAGDIASGVDTASPGNAMGEQLAQGFADGISSGASKAVQAAIDMAEGAVKGAESALLIKSPSRRFAKIGDYSVDGYAKAVNDNDGAERATADMANRAAGGASSGLSRMTPAASGGGSSGPVSFTYAPVHQLPPGSTEETVAAVKAQNAQSQAEFEAKMRTYLRAKREAA